MKHPMRACIATFAKVLSQPWARGTGHKASVASMARICARLDRRLKIVAARAPKRACSVFSTGMLSYSRGRTKQFEFTVTGGEALIVYKHFILCLPGLVQNELDILNQVTEESGEDEIVDPTSAIVDALCKFMVWHRASTCEQLDAWQLSMLASAEVACLVPRSRSHHSYWFGQFVLMHADIVVWTCIGREAPSRGRLLYDPTPALVNGIRDSQTKFTRRE